MLSQRCEKSSICCTAFDNCASNCQTIVRGIPYIRNSEGLAQDGERAELDENPSALSLY